MLTQHSSTWLLIAICLTPTPAAALLAANLFRERLHAAFLSLIQSPEAALTTHSPCKEGHGQVKAVCHWSQEQSTALLGQCGCQQGVLKLSRSPGCPSGRTTEEATWPRGKPPVPLAVQQHRRRKYHHLSSLRLRKDSDSVSVSQHSGDTLTFPDLLFNCYLSPFHGAPGAFAKHCCWVWAIYP